MIKLILGSKACELLSDIILNKNLLGDITKLSPSYQTSSLESYHSVVNTTLLPSCWVFHVWGCIVGKQVQTNTCTHLKKNQFSGYYWLQCISMRTLGDPKQLPNWEENE